MTTEKQSTDTVLMISPDTFQFNIQTADTNAFQQQLKNSSAASEMALKEFHAMVEELRKHNIRVLILPSRAGIVTPDAVFPNNWFSTHLSPDGGEMVILYPMLADSRRAERQWDDLKDLLDAQQIIVNEVKDLTGYEAENKYLEGTGSLVLDRVNRIAFAVLSPRTSLDVLHDFCKQMRYTPAMFSSVDKHGKPVYHTNVVMSIGSQFAVIAADTITDMQEREQILSILKKCNKNIIAITSDQMEQMAGNILEVLSLDGKVKIIMSQTAHDAFTPEQRQVLSSYGDLLVVHIDTIEKLGGGSARCMLAEIFHGRSAV